MKNSEKLKTAIAILIWILVGCFVLYITPLIVVLGILTCTILVFYVLYTFYIYSEFPMNHSDLKRLLSKSLGTSEKEACIKFFKEEKLGVITITYWWNKLIYYLDYELNKQPNETNK